MTTKRVTEFCTKVKVIGAEIASTVVFLIFLYWTVAREISILFR
jgi:hypothetical protein